MERVFFCPAQVSYLKILQYEIKKKIDEFIRKTPPSETWGVWLSDKDSFTLNQLSGVRSLALGMEKH